MRSISASFSLLKSSQRYRDSVSETAKIFIEFFPYHMGGKQGCHNVSGDGPVSAINLRTILIGTRLLRDELTDFSRRRIDAVGRKIVVQCIDDARQKLGHIRLCIVGLGEQFRGAVI